MTRKELRRGSDQKERIVHSISSCRVTSPALPPGAATRRFLKQYVADIPVDDLMSREPRIIAQIAIAQGTVGETSAAGSTIRDIRSAPDRRQAVNGAAGGGSFADFGAVPQRRERRKLGLDCRGLRGLR